MHERTNALVLRAVNYKESDKILTLLTDQQGKLTVSARGCRKKGSAIAAPCQLLCWSELVLYEHRGRWSVKEGLTLEQFRGVRTDLQKLALSCYFAEVSELLCVEGVPNGQQISLVLNSLYALDQLDKPLALVKAAFEMRSMVLAGYTPMVDACAVCGAQQPRAAMLHLQEGLLYCANCQSLMQKDAFMPLSAQGLEALRYIIYGEAKRLFSFSLAQKDLTQLAALTERYLLTQLERGFHTLDYYNDTK